MRAMNCPNCGSYGSCYCTWDDMKRAFRILRDRERERLRKAGRPTVVDQERRRHC